MAKLNKSQAMEAMKNRVPVDLSITDADPRDLRLMTPEELRQAAVTVFMKNHGELLGNTVPVYRESIENEAIRLIIRHWCEAIWRYEESDPVLVAERKARSYRHLVTHMQSEALEVLDRFRKEFDVNPVYAFQSTAAVQAAADLEMAVRAEKMLVTMSVEEVKAEFTDQLSYNGGLRLSGSTCPMTNLIDRAKAIATARLSGVLKN